MPGRGRPTKAQAVENAGQRAVDLVRGKLPELANMLLRAASEGQEDVTCPKCKHKFPITFLGDAKIAQWLWERSEGKPAENKPDSTSEKLAGVIEKLIEARS